MAGDASTDQSIEPPDAGTDAEPDQGETGCIPRTCTQIGANCGEAPDDCGGSIECGECPAGQTCGGGGRNQCGSAPCSPRTCAQAGGGCGKLSDGCSGVIDCGDCTAPETCGGAGIPFQCGCKCTLPNALTACTSNGCAVQACETGFADCNAIATDGCEVATNSDVQNCGTCGSTCSFGNAAASCADGACQLGACNDGYASCDSLSANGCEVNTLTDVKHCGGCDKPCSATNGEPICVKGVCETTDCPPGLGDCNHLAGDGCETNLSNGWKNCGACGNVCDLANSLPACVKGMCAVGACHDGFGNCDNDATNGCETSLSSSPMNCGGCGLACMVPPGAMAACVAGKCDYLCGKLLGDCDGLSGNGCETSLLDNVMHCGGCDMACLFPNAKAGCNVASCYMKGCLSGWADCNKFSLDGCETKTLTDTMNCGSCGNACPAGYVCSNGTCTCPNPCGLTCCSSVQKCCNGEKCISKSLDCPLPR